ncbi:hypothetical protein H4219_004100 [Mycoemilia scoparia]|uniref:Uncharacterized protein n=1 Tax=Mycoemilia scoparia TaxID=417184 RepID=A0A9W7ZYF9_9FUNG|nr:hypothetical protein H4219_004100 [Mycoemilia scoparia]
MDRESWLLWQLADSQLPTGGFVASGGLEAGVQGGFISDTQFNKHNTKQNGAENSSRYTLMEFILSSTYNQARFSLPFASTVHNALSSQHKVLATACEDDPGQDLDGLAKEMCDKIAKLDNTHNAMLASNAVAKRASLAQGMGFLGLFNRSYAAANIFDHHHHHNTNSTSPSASQKWQALVKSIGKELQRMARLGEIRGHWPIVFGFVCAALEIPLARMQQLFLFQYVRQIFSAAVRLNLVGPLRAQTLQCEFYPSMDRILSETRDILPKSTDNEEEDLFDIGVVYTDPLLELYQGMHDRLYSRLFNS